MASESKKDASIIITEAMKKVESQSLSCKDAIRKSFSELQKELQNRESKLIQTVDDTAHNKKGMLEAQLDFNKEKKETSSPIELATEACITYSVDQVELTQTIANAGAVNGSSQDPKEQKGDDNELKDDDSKESASSGVPFNELGKVHEAILEKYKNIKLNDVKVSDDITGLIAFNGYYRMPHAEGAFLTIDTDIIVQDRKPFTFIRVLVSLNGKTCITHSFFDPQMGINGSFVNNKLVFGAVSLDFNRQSSGGIVASFGGTIDGINVTGTTQNNPIRYPVYIGQYYDTIRTKEVIRKLPVMAIKEDYDLRYDYNSNDGRLQPVLLYVYNLNMYFFTLDDGSSRNTNAHLIMGTAAAGGFACNNLSVVGGATAPLSSRFLETIPSPWPHIVKPLASNNDNSALLAPFSGYYGINNKEGSLTGAFVSIQAEYTCSNGSKDWKVLIGVSMDGISSKGYVFDATMSFDADSSTLNISNVLSVALNREYKIESNGYGSLVQMSGTVMTEQVVGCTYFNPVSLSGFGGKYYQTVGGEVILDVKSDTEYVYKGQTVNDFIYVPIMYILANGGSAPIEFSLGTGGTKGQAVIVTQDTDITVAYGIP